MNPLLKLAIFLGLMTVMWTVAGGIAAIIIYTNYGVDIQQIPFFIKAYDNPEAIQAIRLMNGVSQLILFGGSAMLFWLLFGRNAVDRYWFRKPHLTIILVPIVVLALSPIIEISILFNDWLIPVGSQLEAIFKPMEDEAGRITQALVADTSSGAILANLLTMALIPAICEELVFRGVFQGQLAKAFGNIHLAIWGSAILFSAIHMQFYGFIPRMILGAFFGYLVVWTGSIWAPILAHFTNNFVAILIGLFYTENPSLEEGMLESMLTNWLPILSSVVVSFAGIYFFSLKSAWPKIKTKYLTWQSAQEYTSQ